MIIASVSDVKNCNLAGQYTYISFISPSPQNKNPMSFSRNGVRYSSIDGPLVKGCQQETWLNTYDFLLFNSPKVNKFRPPFR